MGWGIGAVLATYLVAAAVKGMTGLGFSTTCLPFLAFIVGLKEALPLVIVPSVASNIVVMVGAGRFYETVIRFRMMLAMTAIGVMLGLWTLASVSGTEAGAALGVILLVWCLFSLLNPSLGVPAHWEKPLQPASGLLTGLVNGVTGSQVFPVVPFLMMLRLERNLFIQAVNCSFTLSSLIMMVGLSRLGLVTTDAIVLSAAGVLVIFFGLRAGERIRGHLSPERFRIAVLLVLMAMGVSLLASAF
ncbi:MAG: sulfite exporter TauE/SafE family protein [Arenibacterium sp.]